MAFDFPPARDGLRVTNPDTGVTYVYREKYQSWIIEGVDNKQTRVHTECCTPCGAQQGDIWYNPCTNCANVYHDYNWLPIVDCTSWNEFLAYKGEKPTFSQLPGKGNDPGDLWVVLDEAALYVWTSNGWLRASSFDDNELRQLIEDEKTARLAGDVGVTQLLTQNKIELQREDKKLWEAIETEEKRRVGTDAVLEAALNECCTRGQEGLEALEVEIQGEAKERKNADDVQQNLIEGLTGTVYKVEDRLEKETAERIKESEALSEEIKDGAQYLAAYDQKLLTLVREKESKYMGEVESRDELPAIRYDWKPLTHFDRETIYSISWGPDCFIAGSSGGHAWSSEDGLRWERRHVGSAFNGNVVATFSAAGVWLIGGDGGFLGRSINGKDWDYSNSTTSSSIQDFAYGKGRFVYVTDGGVVGLSEDNGFTWTKQDRTVNWGEHKTDSILTVTYSEHLSSFVAGTRRGMILISDTGMNWKLIDPNLNNTGQILTIACADWTTQPMLVAGGDFPEKMIYSYDGDNWIKAPKDYFRGAFPTDIKDCGDQLIASLSSGVIAFATDKRIRTWILESTGASERLLSVAFAPKNSNVAWKGGISVAGGNLGQALARQPGNGLEPGDTWIVFKPQQCLYTWSTQGWIIAESTPDAITDIREDVDELKEDFDEVKEGFDAVNDSVNALKEEVVDLSEEVKEASKHYMGEVPPVDDVKTGSFFIDEATYKVYVFNGDTWIQLGGGGA